MFYWLLVWTTEFDQRKRSFTFVFIWFLRPTKILDLLSVFCHASCNDGEWSSKWGGWHESAQAHLAIAGSLQGCANYIISSLQRALLVLCVILNWIISSFTQTSFHTLGILQGTTIPFSYFQRNADCMLIILLDSVCHV